MIDKCHSAKRSTAVCNSMKYILTPLTPRYLGESVSHRLAKCCNDVLYFEQGVESHHIFPVAWCRKYGIHPKKYNCLVNRTPLSAKTNKKIGSKAPSVYLKEFERSGTSPEKLDDMLRSHAIDPTMLRNDDIERFFTTRTKALMELISKAMGKPLTIDLFETCDQEYANGNGNGFINH